MDKPRFESITEVKSLQIPEGPTVGRVVPDELGLGLSHLGQISIGERLIPKPSIEETLAKFRETEEERMRDRRERMQEFARTLGVGEIRFMTRFDSMAPDEIRAEAARLRVQQAAITAELADAEAALVRSQKHALFDGLASRFKQPHELMNNDHELITRIHQLRDNTND